MKYEYIFEIIQNIGPARYFNNASSQTLSTFWWFTNSLSFRPCGANDLLSTEKTTLSFNLFASSRNSIDNPRSALNPLIPPHKTTSFATTGTNWRRRELMTRSQSVANFISGVSHLAARLRIAWRQFGQGEEDYVEAPTQPAGFDDDRHENSDSLKPKWVLHGYEKIAAKLLIWGRASTNYVCRRDSVVSGLIYDILALNQANTTGECCWAFSWWRKNVPQSNTGSASIADKTLYFSILNYDWNWWSTHLRTSSFSHYVPTGTEAGSQLSVPIRGHAQITSRYYSEIEISIIT